MNTDSLWSKQEASTVLHVQLRCGLLSIMKPVSHLANEFYFGSELHRQMSLAAVDQSF